MSDYPKAITRINHIEPVPRRIRAVLGGTTVLDTTSAVYVWEWAFYPQFYFPLTAFAPNVLIATDDVEESPRGPVRLHSLQVGTTVRPSSARVLESSTIPGLSATVKLDWSAIDRWYEEDEQVFVHPRNPYVRVDALRSTRRVRVELEGIVLAESASPVMVFETGLPTRYYLNRTDVDFSHLVSSSTVTECPYKGTTSEYWSVAVGGEVYGDLAWAYDFPTRQLLPITGLVAFYNEKVDIFVDDVEEPRPKTHFS